MAITTQERTKILKLTVGLFNAAPGANYLSEFTSVFEANGHNLAALAGTLGTTGAFQSLYPNFQTASEFATKFLTTLGLQGNTEAVDFVTAKFNAGVPKAQIIHDAVVALGASTSAEFAAAKAILVNKAAVAENYSVTLGASSTSLAALQGALANVTADPASVTAANAANAGGNGQTFTLTKGVDTLVGTAGNDIFVAGVSNGTGVGEANAEINTLSALDSVDGGAGVDTLKVLVDKGATVSLATVKNVEVIEAQAVAALTIDTTTATGVTNLNVTKAAGAVSATAAATTDVSVSVKENAGAAVDNAVIGGKNVTVTLADAGAATPGTNADTITIGTGTAPKGDVVVNVTGVKYDAAGATAYSFGKVTVNGGTTISVTQKATSDASAAATDASNQTVTQGEVAITANASTTTVTVKQDAAVTAAPAVFKTGGVTETASVKFSALTAGQTIIMGGLTFTAPAAITAAEAAAAFANLVNGAAYGTLVPAGDTQGSGLATKGTYTGAFTGWTSAAASGDTVVFTSTTANSGAPVLINTGSGTVTITPTEGKAHDAGAADGKLGVVAGKVTVAADAALKTVTIDSYGAGGSAITGTASALETLNLSNSAQTFGVSSAAATLALNLEKVTGNVSFTTAPATLNVKSVGNNTSALVAEATTALNVSGTGLLNATGATLTNTKAIKVTETAGLNLTGATLTNLASVDTTGTTGTVTVSILGAQATYTGGAGVDNVTVSDAGTAVAKAIDLGAGNDKLTLVGATVVAPAVDLKGGDGTDTLSLDAASAALLGAAFAAKVSGFERLEITGANAGQAVDTAALGNYNDITVTAGNAAAATLTLNNLSTGATIRLNDAVNAVNATDAIVANIKDANKSTTDVLNVAITANVVANATADDHGKITANEVETINVSVIDGLIQTPTNAAPDVQKLTLAADKATVINVTGDTALNLVLDTATKVATIDASAATGALSVDLSAQNGVAMTIKGGSGNDVLAATVGVNAKADVLIGGAGNDTLVAGTNGATLTGGAGNDLFVLGAVDALSGNKEANTYSTITDFAAGDLLKLSAFYDADGAGVAVAAANVVASFSKLGATLNAATAVFSDYVNAAMEQAKATTGGVAGDAVWFAFGGNSYAVVDSGAETKGAFVNGEDLIISLTGVDLTNASFNATQGTIALV